jgi:hypothetical protein
MHRVCVCVHRIMRVVMICVDTRTRAQVVYAQAIEDFVAESEGELAFRRDDYLWYDVVWCGVCGVMLCCAHTHHVLQRAQAKGG